MPLGFFSESQLITSKPPIPRIAQCGICGLYKECKSPKMGVWGNGSRGILLVGEAPGVDEDQRGIPFIGRAGSFLRDSLQTLGLRIRRDCYITNSLICRPPDNRTPTSKEIDYCKPNLINTINRLKPSTIILLGGTAINSVIGWLYGESPGPVEKWVGWKIPSQQLNAWVCPTYHPSYILRVKDDKRGGEVAELMFKKHLKSAVELEGRPWEQVPKWKDNIRVSLNSIHDAAMIEGMISYSKEYNSPIAFDFETNCIKPETNGARVICASLSSGNLTMAFPWLPRPIEVFKKLIQSDCPKFGANIKFEDRWCRHLFGHGVNNWKLDITLAAHTLDNRRGITGLGFQSFVELGFPKYYSHIDPFLKAVKGTKLNRVHEVDLKQLCTYCGLDSLLELEIGIRQMKRLGIT